MYGLLDNPDASRGDLSGWNVVLNGGNGWAVSGNSASLTSYAWGTRTQTIDRAPGAAASKLTADSLECAVRLATLIASYGS